MQAQTREIGFTHADTLRKHILGSLEIAREGDYRTLLLLEFDPREWSMQRQQQYSTMLSYKSFRKRLMQEVKEAVREGYVTSYTEAMESAKIFNWHRDRIEEKYSIDTCKSLRALELMVMEPERINGFTAWKANKEAGHLGGYMGVLCQYVQDHYKIKRRRVN